MYWVDKTVDEIKNSLKEKISKGKTLVIRDEKTASGRVHVGSLRGVAIHGLVHDVLKENNISCKYLYEINDYDPMDGLPVYLDKDVYEKYLGKPLCDVPSPDGIASNFAEFYAQEFIEVIKDIGFEPEYYRSSTLYKDGSYNESIRQALEGADKIREIYKRVSGADKPAGWLPLNIVCENCGKVSTTKATDFDGETVAYACYDLDWTKGCGHKARISPFDGKGKLPWKVEWAAKFKILDVDIEGGGKDHSTKGGSREVAEAIAREVFNHEAPFNIPYEFLQVGGKKMSSSKGKGSSSRDIADLFPSEMVRLLLLQKDPQRVVEFDPEGDTVPVLYDSYDKFATNYFSGNTDDYSRMFKLIHPIGMRDSIIERHLPRFSVVAFLAQMPHLDTIKEVEHVIERSLTDEDKKELDKRLHYAKLWIDTYAPADYKYEMQENLPEEAKNFSDLQKKALKEILNFVEEKTKDGSQIDGQEFHSKLHAMKADLSIEPKELFEAIYISILGKRSGPKAGWFLSVIDSNWLKNRLEEASK